jgi:hypothetical protein
LLSPQQRKIRAQIAHAVSIGDTDRADELRQRYKVAKLVNLIDVALREPPMLTHEDRAALASHVLTGGPR